MKVAIIGAGAVGGLLTARLGATEAEVTLVARPNSAAAIRRNGLTMVTPLNRVARLNPRVTDDSLSLGPQDLVFLCVKSHALRGTIDTLTPLLGPETAIVPMVNGIPWWYPHRQPEPLADRPLASIDPDGLLWRSIDPDRVVGATTFVAVEGDGPCRLRHVSDQRFVFGDIGGDVAGRDNPAVDRIVTLFGQAGFQPAKTADIRQAIWVKLWGNLAFNPLSVLTGSTLGRLCNDPGTRETGRAMMLEAKAVAEKLGVVFTTSVDERIAMAAGVGDFKTSMLQDYEAGRRLELEAILGSVIELAERCGVHVPMLRAVLAMVDLRARERREVAA
ncbi:2-dehydropantoate 2-reductase [Azospirillum sp. TSH7]|uniref:ketopantoate reductase family protein n=1 Tax=unclassified Azospirillum TaxID=2630922 RepID=UPI000D61C577|nr:MULTISPECIES: 2-dehydropantoate 2-reductase [unclassified Azospirillum]PWC60640.1 2-dehydropantoate 2-reductase [Azospirillum sp. TSH7]PWC72091.1 2-dehydropantoate 2-reductase [Azospirillum sp. TSH20]QCG93615.1 2-dehydropantoate 2-reductase [Azospirillum sp. TSA2s]